MRLPTAAGAEPKSGEAHVVPELAHQVVKDRLGGIRLSRMRVPFRQDPVGGVTDRLVTGRRHIQAGGGLLFMEEVAFGNRVVGRPGIEHRGRRVVEIAGVTVGAGKSMRIASNKASFHWRATVWAGKGLGQRHHDDCRHQGSGNPATRDAHREPHSGFCHLSIPGRAIPGETATRADYSGEACCFTLYSPQQNQSCQIIGPVVTKDANGPRFLTRCLSSGLVGCARRGVQPPANHPPETPETKPSAESLRDPDAESETHAKESVPELEAIATSVKRDGDGLITEVSFRGAEITDESLKHLTALRQLRSLLLNETAITDAGLETVGQLVTLHNLDLRGCRVSNEGLTHLSGLRDLRALRLSGSNGATTVDDAGLPHIAGLKQLKVLALDFLWVSEEGLSQLAGLEQLEELYLAKTLVGDESLALLNHFPRLRKPAISQTQVTSAGLEHLAGLTALEDLDLSEDSQIFDEGMSHLSGLTALKRLNLWRVAITDAGLVAIGRAGELGVVEPRQHAADGRRPGTPGRYAAAAVPAPGFDGHLGRRTITLGRPHGAARPARDADGGNVRRSGPAERETA